MLDNVAVVRNCIIPTHLHYFVDQHTWLRCDEDGAVTLGLTDVAQTTAGAILHVTFKRIGAVYPRGKVVAVVESGKWLGPFRTPVSGEIIAVNERLSEDAGLVNRSPYRQGWVVRINPSNLAEELQELVTGEDAVRAYTALMEDKGLDECVHCEGFEI
ncbi:MAG: glycine cleavage system protein GcvH [Anaerolineae bacterium]